ncbi:MAG TPA: YdiU family protein [Candidatus Binatia bacterium]|nr:YdiU family protein [Candidatus Binatia bacterium]
MPALQTLETLRVDNRFAALGEAYFSRVQPASLAAPRLVHFNPDAAALIDLDPAEARRPEFTQIFAGNRPLPGGDPLAMLYAGHQFGVYVPQLGDGRALLLAQVRNSRGETWDLQLKGAGPTPYSRHADGRAVLRSSIREYLCSAAMHRLGIPTTRALCLVASPDPVRRETVESAAVLCRMAPTHVRFGSFEVFYYRGQHELLGPLADHVIAEHFPQHRGNYAAWLGEVVERTARLMAQWQAVGFCHGVMNTDNFSILGITLDYGPYGFIDGFDAHHICNHSDEGGRYAYDRQPMIGHWNCSRLLQACLPLLDPEPERAVEIGGAILDRYAAVYAAEVTERWTAKLGLHQARDGDPELVNRFLTLLHQGHSDFTRSFRGLAHVRAGDNAAPPMRDQIHAVEAFDAWLVDYRARLRGENADEATRAAAMNAVNPKYVLRNHLAQRAIELSEAGDDSEVDRLMRVLRAPYDEQPEFEAYAAEPPPSATHIAVSCSS